ncbi:MAG: hypothetical protein OCD00_17245 [Colwellia sp.]
MSVKIEHEFESFPMYKIDHLINGTGITRYGAIEVNPTDTTVLRF